MTHKREYLKYMLPIDKNIVILSTKLAELLSIPHDDFLKFLEDKKESLPKQSTVEIENQITITKKGINALNKILIGKDEICRDIIDTMMEMSYLAINSEVLQNWILEIHQKDKINLEELQSGINEVLEKESQKRKKELYNILTPQEREALGLS